MLDFRLQVFYAVAKRLSFTKAAAELYISQPAVTRHIKELEEQCKASLFERSGNRQMHLTPAGEVLLQYVVKLMGVYNELEYELNLLNDQHTGTLRIGASTTVGQYVLPAILAKFRHKHSDVDIKLIMGNTEEIEQALINKEIELGVIEGVSRNVQIKYEQYLNDELVLVCSTANTLHKKSTLKLTELPAYPIVLREHGSGTLETIIDALKAVNIKPADLQIEMQLGSTESIKEYLLNSNCMAFMSIHSILKELKNNQLRIIDVKDLSITRRFQFIQLYGHLTPLAEMFIRFIRKPV